MNNFRHYSYFGSKTSYKLAMTLAIINEDALQFTTEDFHAAKV